MSRLDKVYDMKCINILSVHPRITCSNINVIDIKIINAFEENIHLKHFRF